MGNADLSKGDRNLFCCILYAFLNAAMGGGGGAKRIKQGSQRILFSVVFTPPPPVFGSYLSSLYS